MLTHSLSAGTIKTRCFWNNYAQPVLIGAELAGLVGAPDDGGKALVHQDGDKYADHSLDEGEGHVEHEQAVKKPVYVGIDSLVHADDLI